MQGVADLLVGFIEEYFTRQSAAYRNVMQHDEERVQRIRDDLVKRIRPVCPDMLESQFDALIERMVLTELRDLERLKQQQGRP